MPNFRSTFSDRGNVTSEKKTNFNFNFIDPIARFINKKLSIDQSISRNTVKKVSFGFILIFVYIFIQHRYDALIRKLNKSKLELQEVKSGYINYKSKYLSASMQSELSKTLESEGFQKTGEPPVKIATHK